MSDLTKVPVIDFSPPQKGPMPIVEDAFGFNISKSISRTMIFYTQGLFLRPGLPHRFSHNESVLQNERIHIVNPNSDLQLNSDQYPRIVVQRGRLSGMGRGGIGNFLKLDQYTGDKTHIDLFQCPVQLRFYGTYQDVELYSSMVFLSLRFLTKPLRLFTIFKVGNPSLDKITPYKSDVKNPIWMTSIDVMVWKEGLSIISEEHLAQLRGFAFKCVQTFHPMTGNKVKVTIS